MPRRSILTARQRAALIDLPKVQAATVAQAQFHHHRDRYGGRVSDGGNAMCRNIERKEERTTIR